MAGDGSIQTFEFYHTSKTLSFYKNQDFPEYLEKDLTIFRKCY